MRVGDPRGGEGELWRVVTHPAVPPPDDVGVLDKPKLHQFSKCVSVTAHLLAEIGAADGQIVKPPVSKPTSPADSVPYRVIETRGGVRIAIISPKYKSEPSLRRLGDHQHKDVATMVPIIVVVFDNETAAKLFVRYGGAPASE
jgi:hypothetical protein